MLHFRYILVFFFFFASLFAQTIVINEVSALNSSTISDINDEFYDWIEIFNNSSSDVNLSNYYLSDSKNELSKWQFPHYTLKSDSFLVVFASNLDITSKANYYETIVREGDVCKYLLPSFNLGNTWKGIVYDDSGWEAGNLGVGYGDNDDQTVISQSPTVYIRKTFEVTNLNDLVSIYLSIDYDDGYVAYLNGEEVARENLGSPHSAVSYSDFAEGNHEAQLYQNNSLPLQNITKFSDIIVEGVNVLTIEVHNVSSSSSDLTCIPFLTLGYESNTSIERGLDSRINISKNYYHTNFKVDSKGEQLFISDENKTIIDSIETEKQIADVSVGRFPDASSNIYYFSPPTPGKSNKDIGFTQFLEEPEIKLDAGFYNSSIEIKIKNQNDVGELRYTLDGSDPNKDSELYSQPITLSKTTVLKVKAFADGFSPSKTITRTYFIKENVHLPVISLSTAPENFFDIYNGIYVKGKNAESSYPYFGANFWEDWEKPIHFEYFNKNGEQKYEASCGVKIFGKWSRGNPQKSLAFIARNKYGYSSFNYKFFDNSNINEFNSFVLRNSGNDWNYSMLRDAAMTSIVDTIGVDKQNYEPVVLFINGEYWGVHNLREKINEHYIASKYNIKKDDINILESNQDIAYGELGNYPEILEHIENADMSNSYEYGYLAQHIDLVEFIDYYLAEIFFDNGDWPGNNIKYWQQRSNLSKWRWILYDTDFGYGLWQENNFTKNSLVSALTPNGNDWPNPPWSTFLMRKCLENPTFRAQFLSRYAVLTNTIFKPEYMKEIIDSLASNIRPEMNNHFSKWGGNINSWENEISIMNNFADKRSSYLSAHFVNYFGLDGYFNLSLENDIDKGELLIENYNIKETIWEARLFQNTNIKVEAIPKLGYSFSHWEGDVEGNRNPLFINSSKDITIRPVYVSNEESKIVINEINYNSTDIYDTDDWIELYNYSSENINISGWYFIDEEDSFPFTFPDGTILNSGEYLVLCRDTLKFNKYNPNLKKLYGNFEFGLSGGGEKIFLFNNYNRIVDSLTYDDKSPWPAECDGNGPTLELKNYTLDNSKYYNWKPSEGYGSPGKENSIFTDVHTGASELPNQIHLYQNFPNPFNPETRIRYYLPSNKMGVYNVKLEIFNVLGQKVTVLVNKQQRSGLYEVAVNNKSGNKELSSGVYIYTLIVDSNIQSKKMLLLK